MADLIIGKTTEGHKLPVLVDSQGKLQVSGLNLEPYDAAAIENKLDTANGNLGTIASDCATLITNSTRVPGFALPTYDYIACNYTGSNMTGVVYKIGGSSGTTVATLTLGYDGNGNLTSVAKS